MMKHAFLIMAHHHFSQLKKLITLLDDPRNDLFLHVDVCAEGFDQEAFASLCQHSSLYFLKRQNVLWADYSQVDITLQLLQKALQTHSSYAYFHLLSGADLPLQTQDDLHRFFDSSGKEFVGIVPKTCPYTRRHVQYYYPLLRLPFYRKYRWVKGLSSLLVMVQKCLGVNRIKNDPTVYVDGWTWFSITHSFATYVLKQAKNIRKRYQGTLAPDEIFLQTLAFNSPFKERLYSVDDLQIGSQRCIDWQRGKPYTYTIEDAEMLMNSGLMFARKFDDHHCSLIIDAIDHTLRTQEERSDE